MTDNIHTNIKRKRKTITPRTKLQVFKRDKFTCQTCGKSHVTYPNLYLEVDHIKPFSHGGADELSNFQTLCAMCNRGKSNDENLNRTIKDDLNIFLNHVNPQIVIDLNSKGYANIVANQEEFAKIFDKNSIGKFYQLEILTNSLSGLNVGRNLGIYTLNDYGGVKIHFLLRKNP